MTMNEFLQGLAKAIVRGAAIGFAFGITTIGLLALVHWLKPNLCP
jgi:hypothetical protein